VQNSTASSDPKNPKCIQTKFVALALTDYLPQPITATFMLMLFKYFIYALYVTEYIKPMQLLPLMLFGLQIFPTSKDNIGLRVPTRNLRDCHFFYVCPSLKDCPSARCTTVADLVCSDRDTFSRQMITLSHI
jgi:hypothetical protein